MAYQPKSYRKFVATAATATLVATAVTPAFAAETGAAASFTDVSDRYKEAVDYLVNNKITLGLTETSFGTEQSIKRVDAAVMIAKALEIEISDRADSGFSDVPARAKLYVDALKAEGIINGKTATTFGSEQNITRGEIALILAKAYGLTGDADVNFTDVGSRYTDAVEALVANKITQGKTTTSFGTTDAIKRGEFAIFLYKAEKIVEVTVPTVVNASAVNNGTSVTISGKVENASAASIVILDSEDKEVYDQNVSLTADGTFSQTIALPEGNYTYEVRAVEGTEESAAKAGSFRVTLADVEAAAVTEATYDDDIADQFVAITVDGKKVNAQDLINAGYTVQFQAFDSKAATTSDDVTANLFAGDASTGELNTDLASAFGAPIPTSGLDLYAKVTLTKGSEVITSGLSKITIKNLDLAADSITSARLVNGGADADVAVTTDNFRQSSSTLVTGETAVFDQLKVKSGSDEEEVISGFTVKSSNPAVVSVATDDVTGVSTLTAQGPGTATVTVTYGGATLTKTITVTNAEREATKVSVDKSTVTVAAENGSTTVKVKLLDQYGDPVAVIAENALPADNNVNLVQSNPTKVLAVLEDSEDETGEATLTLTGQDDGTGSSTITFRDAAGVKIGTTSVTANVTANNDLAQYSLAVDTDISATDITDVGATTKDQVSTDATLDNQSDKFLKLNIKGLNSAGVEVSDQEVDGTSDEYLVTVNPSAPNVIAGVTSEDGYLAVEAGTKTGTATITVTNANNSKIVKTFKVTVTSVGYNVTGAALKNVEAPTYAQTLNYEDFLTFTKADKDPVISGLSLTKTVAQPVRLDLDGGESNTATDTSVQGSLYIDKNADGEFNLDDSLVGRVTITTTGSIDAAVGATLNPVDGVDVASGDDGTVLFKVLDSEENVVATKAVSVDF
ncbi:S-layer homology domain-containing protein [Domibacillus sp. A3M-37]|uniref:S-layer homology domain-containing protein n=1 Tax=Domibacillus sp. A3M-37 TaxID=2962037 RepID=UPI0020B83445|nr:S-layer homology domain-containing protein [Domibacillus sp. A3M-37]MCP3761432.1 S-layer homology domain-containing protein [Domibacillus sp. A3M-37]